MVFSIKKPAAHHPKTPNLLNSSTIPHISNIQPSHTFRIFNHPTHFEYSTIPHISNIQPSHTLWVTQLYTHFVHCDMGYRWREKLEAVQMPFSTWNASYHIDQWTEPDSPYHLPPTHKHATDMLYRHCLHVIHPMSTRGEILVAGMWEEWCPHSIETLLQAITIHDPTHHQHMPNTHMNWEN